MRLSPAMKQSLRDKFKCDHCCGRPQQPGPVRSRIGRPGHYGNLVTHNALLRRGLIQEADDDFHTITFTKLGLDIACKLTQEADQ